MTKGQSGRCARGVLVTVGNGWGGRRSGAGRKPKGEYAGVAHGRRPVVRPSALALVTLELLRGLPDLRRAPSAELLGRLLAVADGRFGLHILEHSLYPDHLHLIVRAHNTWILSRGMKGLCVRAARRLNALWRRSGPVFADRFEVRVLANPRAQRAARHGPCSWRTSAASPSRPATCLRALIRRGRA